MNGEQAKKLAFTLLGYAVVIYVLYAVLDRLREAKGKQVGYAILFALLGFAVGGFWMYKHLTCEGCQQRLRGLRRKVGMAIIPDD